MRVIGTAGHVDHGKSTLIEALTGTHPDRLKEEKEREMTIDLGFAWLTLPDGEEVGIVDVPGHRDFIENMLAGIAGIDATIFVVAADEGVMPQTREHLAILDILAIPSGVVALTKVDLVDQEWADLVEEDLYSELRSTVLESAPIIRVSAKTAQGLPELISALEIVLAEHPPRQNYGRPRLPIDRVFTISGFGTIVTGTLSDGELRTGDEIEILPTNLKGRIRGLETHKRKSSTAVPGSRTAINISGISFDKLKRGDVVSQPGKYIPTQRIDVQSKLLENVTQELKHDTEVKLFIGSSEILSRVRVLGARSLPPGEEGWLQIETTRPVVTMRGDRFILRRPSPGETIGGGVVLDPHPKGRHKRFTLDTESIFQSLSEGTLDDLLEHALKILQPANLHALSMKTNLGVEELMPTAIQLLIDQEIINLSSSVHPDAVIDSPGTVSLQQDDPLITKQFWSNTQERLLEIIDEFHRTNPLRKGIPREELRSRLTSSIKLSAAEFDSVVAKVVSGGYITDTGPIVYRKDHHIKFTGRQQSEIEKLLDLFRNSPFSPPSVKECQAMVGNDVFAALIDLDILIAVSKDVVFRREDYQQMISELEKLFAARHSLTAAEVRDHFKTSRKYALSLLEHLDSTGMTVREGDSRRLRNKHK